MNTIEQLPVSPDQALEVDSGQESDGPAFEAPKINGFENGARPLLKEPSVYLSIAIVLIATAVCFSKTPLMFWLSLGLMSALALGFHVMAERFLFRSVKEHQIIAAPLEGIFVLTLGAVLPGVSLLAYGAYSLTKVQQANFGEEFAKLALLLVVPFFNFVVWSAVRKRYLVRPRLTGLMNGFALGLSAVWSAIWASTVMLGHSNPSCKLGWMLLLCTAPFLLFAAFCLGLDLWNKTEKNIRRVTTTFSVLGLLLSLLFVFTPMARTSFVQSLIFNGRQATPEDQESAISNLRTFATDEDLRPSKYPVSGFALAALLIPNRGLESGGEADNELYFKVTGKPYSAVEEKKDKLIEHEQISAVVGTKIPGLSLAKSQIAGNIDAATLSSSLDWTLSFHNSSTSAQEVRCEIAMPKQAVVSRATVWINGEGHEGTFTTAAEPRPDQANAGQNIEPLLVTMTAPDRVLVQCYPLRANGGEMKIRLGFKLPLEAGDGKNCALKLPHLVATNFIQSKRQRVNFVSRDLPLANSPGLIVGKDAGGYSLSGVIKTRNASARETLIVQRLNAPTTIATLDGNAIKPRYIVQSLKAVTKPTVKRLYVVIDSSAALKEHAEEIKEALAAIPTHLKPTIHFAGKSAQAVINSEAFSGGQDNWPILRATLETAAEEKNSAVLWIHGPQPIAPKLADSAVLDLVHGVALYDLQMNAGQNALLPALQTEDVSGLVAYENFGNDSSTGDLHTLATIWNKGATKGGARGLVVQRSLSFTEPQCPIVSDPLVSAQITCLWARGEVVNLMASGHQYEAQVLAANYHLITPATGAVVLQNDRDYKGRKRGPATYKEALGRAASIVYGGLVGAPVDPRYGQSNEVGQLADYGYDCLRDISRLMTAIAFLISSAVAIIFVKGQKLKTGKIYGKAFGIVLAATTVVHLIGTFVINNCGGLGGGL
mgnify:CR=1 FL=1